MNISKFILILILAVIGTGSISADNRQSRKYIRHGNSLYRSGKHREALVDYYKAMRADSTNARALYNLGTSMFPEQWKVVDEHQRDTMINYFKSAAQHETTPYRKSQAFHNIGVEAYKMALRFNPNDDETRYNLVLCQRQLKKQGGGNNNQQNKQDNQQDKQDQQKQQDKQQQQKQDKQQEQQEPPMSKENAEQLLNAAMQQEKQTQQRMQDAKQQQSKRRRIEKNW